MDATDPDDRAPRGPGDVVAAMYAHLRAKRPGDAARIGLEALAALPPGAPREFEVLGVLYHQILAKKPTKKLALAAIPAYEVRVPVWEARYGADHAIVTETLGELARLYCFAGQRDREAATLQRVLAAIERRLGPECPAVPSCVLALATALAALGRRSEAEVLFVRALAYEKRHGSPAGPTAVAIFEALAGLHHAGGDPERADHYASRAAAARATWTSR